MFSIKINRIVETGENLERILFSLNQEIYEVERVMRNLNSLSCMEEVRYGLRGQLQNLNEEKRRLGQMIKCLNKIILSYNSCENRIQDYAEQETVYYQRREIGLNNLQNVSTLLKNIV